MEQDLANRRKGEIISGAQRGPSGCRRSSARLLLPGSSTVPARFRSRRACAAPAWAGSRCNRWRVEYRRIAGQPIESVVSQLRPKVDLFFDKVLVNAPEDDVRRNRLMLLGTLLQIGR